jgi:uncharacterized membrane protein
MILEPRRLLRISGTLVVVVVWAVLAHLGSSAGEEGWVAALGMLPLLVAVVLLFWRPSHPVRSLLVLMPLAGLLIGYWPLLSRNLALLYFMQHFGINLALAVLFGRTLHVGEPLITRIAARVHEGQLSARQIRYTRQATLAWTIFFLLNAAISTLLFVLATPTIWSVFANLLAMPLLGAMFVVEYVWRAIVLPPDERPSIAQVVQASRRIWGGQSVSAGSQ